MEDTMTGRYLTSARLRELAGQLSDRDYAVVREIAALRFVSGSQLASLCFADADDRKPNVRAARRASQRLTSLQVLDRLPRQLGGVRGGSAGFVYHLGLAGQRLSMERGWLAKGRPRRPLIPGRLFVRHALAIAELHTRLVEGGRSGRFELLERTCEPACWRNAGGIVLKSDTYIRLGIGAYEDSYFIEVDRGTEGSRAIERQLDSYLAYHQSGHEQAEHGVFPKVLWLAPEPNRTEAIGHLISRLPEAEQELFSVNEFDDAISVVSGSRTANNAL
jgi:hypothetical protein